jgi:hypothetical protein
MRDLLVRYLLGELNAQDREQLEAQLRDSPELRRELAYLQACLPSVDDECASPAEASSEAPRGLAERTLGHICGDSSGSDGPRSAEAVTAAYEPPTGTPRWSLADLTVAGGVFLAISMLFLPALRQSRDAARRTGCADNLRQLGTMLVSYSDQHGRFFPMVTRNENAGVFAVYLLEDGYAGADELARLLVCRSSQLAEDVSAKQVFIRVPTMCELAAASCDERKMWRRLMGGSYAYQLGYVEGDRHCAVRNEGSGRRAILADAPSEELDNLRSANHGGCGQNVLYEDLSVRFQKPPTYPEAERDDLYRNYEGQEAAGLDRFDTVLGRSEVTPGQVTAEPASPPNRHLSGPSK